MVGLVYWENGFRNLTNNKRPITKLEDLPTSSCA
jgi:TRAP-type C4-dicarboxylate transport system substrate-binding protein